MGAEPPAADSDRPLQRGRRTQPRAPRRRLLGAPRRRLGRRAVETHEANIGGLGYVGDLSDPAELIDYLEAGGSRSVDLVAGGPPCQPFSRAGRSMIRNLVASGSRSADDPRAELWQGFMAVVEHLRPRAVLVENVPDLPSWDDGSVLMGFYESLGDLGYTVDARVLDAFQYGVPQHRARLFLVGLRQTTATFEWPEPVDEITTLRDAIGDLPPVPPAQRTERIPYFGPRDQPSSGGCATVLPRRTAQSVYDHITRDVRPDDAEAFALLGEGQTYMDLPSTSAATAATSSPTSTSDSRGTRSAGASPPTSPRTATGTSIPSSTGRSRSARPHGSRPSPTGSGSRASRPSG